MIFEPLLYGLMPEHEMPFSLSALTFGCKYHWHDHVEMLLLREGECMAMIEGQAYKMRPDALLLVGSREQHNTYNISPDAAWYVLQIKPEVICPECMNYTNAKYMKPFLNGDTIIRHEIREDENREIFRVFRDLIGAYDKRPLGYEMYVYAKILELFSLLIRYDCISLSAQNQRKQKDIDLIREALDHIHRHYSDPLRIEDMIALTYTCRATFSKVFKNACASRRRRPG